MLCVLACGQNFSVDVISSTSCTLCQKERAKFFGNRMMWGVLQICTDEGRERKKKKQAGGKKKVYVMQK